MTGRMNSAEPTPSTAITVTALYVPGDRPDRFDKAVASGAHLVIFDLEDAVAPENKAAALDAVADYLATPRTVRTQVRINRGSRVELTRLAGLPGLELRLPKVETVEEVTVALDETGAPVTALIESALGLERAFELATGGASALALGDSDLASELGSADQRVLDWARVRIRVAAAAAGLPAPMLSVYPGLHDVEGLARDTVRGAALGFVGRAAAHPRQLPVIVEAFRPAPEQCAWAAAVIAALDATNGVSTLPSGEMVDAAMRRRAEQLLALAHATA